MGQMAGGEGANQGSGEGGDGGNPLQKLLLGGLKGGLSGFSDMQKQNQMLRQGGPSMQVPMPQQPQVQLPGMDGQQNSPFKPLRGNNLAFYGGGQ